MAYNFQGGRGRGGYSRGHHFKNTYYKNTYPKFEDLSNEQQVKTLNYMSECLKFLITPKGRKFVNDGNISWANDVFTQFSLAKTNEKLKSQGKATYDNNAFITNEIYYLPDRIHTVSTFFKSMTEFGLLNIIRSKDDEFVTIKPYDNSFDLLQSKINKCTSMDKKADSTDGAAKAVTVSSHQMISSDEDEEDDDDQ